MILNIETAPLDDACKAILTKLKLNGFDEAGVPYVVDESFISEAELSYLLQHGGMNIDTGNANYFGGVLGNYAKPKFGPEVGKISFKLKMNLA
ncbi:hypothetical protein BM43_7498 (plasmid) [Burkholderia gladioli]|uniref:Uncharacterized protein n=1 Tax=Burkholderia gladioli TaxID=28095 RepID=A0AAW3F895_BURGA|nr:hypothetical protein [Burkholderia gladioli]AJW93710.1 hypothetical protein BM43_7498 [Burkholderia gladioli]ASD84643.1 hypothetical protein CEJ98_37385 [Burkholderia gladioli pv. gladioli]KGC16566.1 hypothetical protein DM48_3362 [Burkholderia gladioli]QPQ88928.1 hypothetical protein I6H08_36630 [Burkholderia gladioli]SPU96204.1 Uncharacterised protein [Burkholderia gladioli]